MSTPRVLQVVLSLDPGGTERLVYELVVRLGREIPTMVCCLGAPGAWGEQLQAQGVAVAALNRQPGFQPRLSRGVAQAARAHGATIVHAHHYSPFVYSALARWWSPHAPVVFTEHGRLSDAGPSKKRLRVNRLMARLPRRVFAVSGDLRAHLIAEGFPASTVGVIHNGIDVGPLPNGVERARIREQLGVDDRTVVIGTIARLDPVKNLDALIRAIASVPPGASIVAAIIGDGAEREPLERLAASRGIESKVRFLGHRDDARSWLAGCDIYVNSSISEGVSLTILEAMAAGLPIIATAVGGTPEVVDPGCSRLVPSRDDAALTNAIVELAGSPTLRGALGAAARIRVEREFTLDRMIGQYRDVYITESARA